MHRTVLYNPVPSDPVSNENAQYFNEMFGQDCQINSIPSSDISWTPEPRMGLVMS